MSIDRRAFPANADLSVPLRNGSVRFGRNVLDDLVIGVRESASRPRTRRAWGIGAIGSTMWMDDPDLVDAFHDCTNVCILITKQTPGNLAKPRAQAVKDLADAKGLFQKAFYELHDVVPGGGEPLVVGPGTPQWLDNENDDEPAHIGGVREVGFRQVKGQFVPIVHSKMLLLGRMWWHDEHPSGYPGDIFGFRPERLWVGSANFTQSSRGGLEMGMWTSDPDLMQAARQYLMALVIMSEPLGEGPDLLTPDLIPVEYDDEAFSEYLADLGSPDWTEFDDSE